MNFYEIGKAIEKMNVSDGKPENLSGLEKTYTQDTAVTQPVEGMGKEYDPQSEVTKIHTINESLEGKPHPVTGVLFTRDTVELPNGKVIEGVFPEFDSAADVQLAPDENGEYKGTRPEQAEEANKALKEQVANNPELRDKFTAEQLKQIESGKTPKGYVWHHNQEPGKMQLVDQKIHDATAHTGGYSLWGKDD